MPVAEPEPAPPYNLEADIAERKAIARSSLGKKVRLAQVEGVFLVVGDPTMTKSGFRRALRLIRKTVAAYMNNRMSTLPERAVGIYLFSTKRPYVRYCKKYYGGCGTPFGVYYHADRRIVMNIGPGAGTLTHELVHPIIEVDFPGVPDWINEGIASLFERPSFPRPGEIRGRTNWRLPRLVEALHSDEEREFASLDRLFGMSNNEFRGPYEDLHYSMARYLSQWLDKNKQLWPFYQAWRDNIDRDPTGERSFEQVVGKTPAEANEEWRMWVLKL